MASTTGAALVANPINLSGALYNKTRVDTPLFSAIPNRRHDARLFITGATYDTGYPSSAVAGISENASMTAPDPLKWTRENAYNVTQIFQRSVKVSYRKMSNAGDLTNYGAQASNLPVGALAGDKNNVPNELAFQLTNQLDAMRLDIEYVLLNGTFNDSKGNPDQADQTRGIIAAVTSNVMALSGTPELKYEHLYDLAEKVMLSGSPYGLDQYVTVMSFTQFKQLQKIITDEGIKVSQSSAGVNLYEVMTPFGMMKVLPHRFCPAGTVVCICMPVMSSVEQNVPGKGNFFYEPLAKTGAAESGEIFGQWGLDYGPEFLHAKITGLSTTTTAFTAPKVFVENQAQG